MMISFLVLCMKACFCAGCYQLQIQNEIMVKEKLHYSCASLGKDGGAPPKTEEMER